MPVTKNNKLMQIMNYRIRVILQDGRTFIGTFKAFDKHMNLILSECDEYRRYRSKGDAPPREEKRVLGFVLLRGDSVVTITTEGPPPPDENLPRLPLPGAMPGPGTAHPAGRGIPPPHAANPMFGKGPQPMVPGMAHGTFPGVGAPSMGMMQ